MVQSLKTKIIPLSRIQLSRSQLRGKNFAARRKAMLAIRSDGQQHPLLIDPDGRLLSDTASYFALKALNYDFVKVLPLTDPSPVAVEAVGRWMELCAAIRRETVAFNAALASLDHIVDIGARGLVLDLVPVVIARTGEISIRLLPATVSDDGRRMPLDI